MADERARAARAAAAADEEFSAEFLRLAAGPFPVSNQAPSPRVRLCCFWCYVVCHSTLTRPPHRYS